MKIKNAQLIFFLVLFTTAGWLRSSPAQQRLTLEQCLKLAFKNSRLLKTSEMALQIADEKIAQSKAQQLPTINISSMYTRVGKVTEFSVPSGPGGQKRTFRFGTPNRMNFEVKLQMPVFTWGRIGNTIALSKTGRNLSELDKKQQIVTLTDQTLRAFYAVLLNQEVIRLHEANLRRAKDHLQATREQYDAGLVPKLETLRAAVQVKNIQTLIEEAHGNLEKSRISLAKIVGKNADIQRDERPGDKWCPAGRIVIADWKHGQNGPFARAEVKGS